ncbi:MAG: PAS domain-containing protein [Gammaproteobacteria bacterium]|nr:PAS domain-containing protein [Gammaproteobacteria bacterium]
MINTIIEFVFGAALFINAILFIPQAYRIFKEKTSQGVSLLTFAGFLLIQFTIVMHGIINQDSLLVVGYLLSMLTCGLVVFLTIMYRKNIRCCSDIILEDILEQLPGHIYWKDKNGVCLGCNRSNWSDFGLNSLEEFVGKTDHDLFPKEQADKILEADQEVMRTGEVKVCEEELTGLKKALYLSHKMPLKDRNGNIIGILGTSIDITPENYK